MNGKKALITRVTGFDGSVIWDKKSLMEQLENSLIVQKL
jgi:GDP-D-mannose dehydratase